MVKKFPLSIIIFPSWLICLTLTIKSFTNFSLASVFGIVRQSSFEINKICLLVFDFIFIFTISNERGVTISKNPNVL